MITADVIDLGNISYKEAWEIQEQFFNEFIKNKNTLNISNYKFLFCEHPHVYTLGKSGDANNLLINPDFLNSIQATYYKTNRGGDITYHGPGQIVGYPILDIEKLGLSVRTYVEAVEEAIILTLKDYSIDCTRLEGATGVWLDAQQPGRARKICAIGIKASRYITMHGFALNVNTDLKYFNYINPCGFTDKSVTSVEKELGQKINLAEVKEKLIKYFELTLKIKFNLSVS